MEDWIGLAFIVLLVVGSWIGLRALSRQRDSSEDEFEKNAAESTSLFSAGVNALHGILNPGFGKGEKAVKEVRKGTYNKKKRQGKSIGDE